jgi:HD-GYP domain-containing protein (c-di-GMP phosphodiesterase class II)
MPTSVNADYDGTGYPAGRSGEEIPLESRLISTADAFAAMTGQRPYRCSRERGAQL